MSADPKLIDGWTCYERYDVRMAIAPGQPMEHTDHTKFAGYSGKGVLWARLSDDIGIPPDVLGWLIGRVFVWRGAVENDRP